MSSQRGRGRPPVSSREAVEETAVRLFLERGFDKTTIVDIAAECGMSRTSFFRYYSSKSEILWGPFDDHLLRLDRSLRSRPREEPVMTAVLRALVETFSMDVDAAGVWLRRFRLQETAEHRPAESVHWLEWAAVVSRFVRERSGAAEDDFTPEAIGGAVQGALLAFIRTRAAEQDRDPSATLVEFEARLHGIFGGLQHLVAREIQ
jgi:TetR/AcrR family transcriptional regulator, regulator of mycofactocin system